MISLDKIKLFSCLSQEELEFLSRNLTKKGYEDGQIIYSPMDRCSSLCFIIEGEVRLSKFSGDGGEQLISILMQGDIFGEALVFENSFYPVYVTASGACVIGCIRAEILLELTKMSTGFTLQYFAELTKKIRILNDKIEYLSYPNVKQRLARFLLKIASQQESAQISIKKTKQDIAQVIGTSREVVSRNFSAMEKKGYFRSSGKLLDLNIEKLEKIL